MALRVLVVSTVQKGSETLGELLKAQLLNYSLPSSSSKFTSVEISAVSTNELSLPENQELVSKTEVLVADPPLVLKNLYLFTNLKWLCSTFAGSLFLFLFFFFS